MISKYINWMPVTFIKMNSFIGNFQDSHFKNTFRKLILKCTSLLLKNTFKSPKIQKKFQKKIERIKCMSFCATSEVDLGLLQHLRQKSTLLSLHTYTYSVLFLLLILIPFTAFLHGLTQYIRLCFS